MWAIQKRCIGESNMGLNFNEIKKLEMAYKKWLKDGADKDVTIIDCTYNVINFLSECFDKEKVKDFIEKQQFDVGDFVELGDWHEHEREPVTVKEYVFVKEIYPEAMGKTINKLVSKGWTFEDWKMNDHCVLAVLSRKKETKNE